jgi:hypothetical protein
MVQQKYLFKYVTKGPDCSKAYLQKKKTNGEDTPLDEETNTRNEVKEYLGPHYICAFDSCWRVFGFEIHRHYPSVERIPVHLPNDNYITIVLKLICHEWFLMNFFLKQR